MKINFYFQLILFSLDHSPGRACFVKSRWTFSSKFAYFNEDDDIFFLQVSGIARSVLAGIFENVPKCTGWK